MRFFICGSALRGQPDHKNLGEATFAGAAMTAPRYRLTSVNGQHPGIYEVPSGGVAIAGEIYELSDQQHAHLISTEPPNLYEAPIALADGSSVSAMIYPKAKIDEYGWPDISQYGGWAAYRASDAKRAQMASKPGFLAALDQSGGSTPGALSAYGIPPAEYHGDDEMFRLMHEMRVRIMSAASFTGEKVIAAILFERTMDGQAQGKAVPSFLWEDRGIVPLLKIDKGLETEADGVSMMKPIPGLDDLLARAVPLGVYGTKMRSTVTHASTTGIAAIVQQQFEVAEQILKHGLIPILEPEVSIKSPEKAAAEDIMLAELHQGLDALPAERRVMLKLTIPDKADLYAPLIAHPRVERVVALSGGYPRTDACARLARNHGMIASFSRALIDGLTKQMSDAEFDAALKEAIDEIYTASTVKV